MVVQGGVHVVRGSAAVNEQGRVQPSNGTLVDFRELPPEHRKEIELRMAFIEALRAGHVTRGDRRRVGVVVDSTAKRLGLARAPSASSVMDWVRRFEQSECSPIALLSLKKLRRHERRLHETVEKIVAQTLRSEYFTRSRLSLRHAHDCIRTELARRVKAGDLAKAEATVSYATLHRRTRDVDAYHRIASREGDSRARMVCRTAIDGGSASYPMQRVEVDHTVLDWVVVCDRTGLPLGRPTLTVAVDAFSGYLVGFYLSFYGPGVTSVAGVLRNTFEAKDELTSPLKLEHRWLSHGLADEWLLDNGLEFHADVFKNMSWALGIDMTYCRVRTPWLKPHVERFFGNFKWLTLNAGRVHKPKSNVVNPDPYKGASISFTDLVKGLTMFVVDVYPFAVNERKLARPYDLFLEGIERCPPAAYPGSPESLRLISGLSKRLTVDQGGVTLMGLPYGGTELLALRRTHGRSFKTLCKWDPNDMSALFVQDPMDQSKWITASCTWRDYAEGLSWNQHNLIRAFKRKELSDGDSQDLLWQARTRLHEHWMDSSRPKKRADSLLAGRFAGLTSSKVLAGEQAGLPSRPDPAPILVEATPTAEHAIPDFEVFEMEGL